MFNNPYMNNYNVGQQSLNERIDNQIAQLQQMKEQMKNNQQPAINQTFQLAPTNNNHGIRYANTIEEVAKEHPIGKYAITTNGHITALINGKLIDTFNPSNRVMRCAWKIL